MAKNRKKRNAQSLHGSEPGNASIGVANTLANLQQDGDEDSARWTVVEGRGSKLQKGNDHNDKKDAAADKSRKPTLNFAPVHKINSMLKLNDLQTLLLYCLADGTAPQWVSISHHQQIKKAVVIMVPGLEKSMFTGKIQLPDTGSLPDQDEQTNSHEDLPASDQADMNSQLNDASVSANREGPEDYLPLKLDKTKLPSALTPLADHFEHLWPVRTPGDDKGSRIHSPLHAILSSPIPKTKEEKEQNARKGVKPALQMNSWIGERTPITKFLATRDELAGNYYVLHPALFNTEQEKLEIQQKRKADKFSADDGWKDTLVESFSDGLAPEDEIESGSITVGRTLYALDCEMCLVEGDEFALTRISIVGWDGEPVMDEYVRPDKPIKDYLTQYSGVTPEALANVTTSLGDIQERLLELLHPRVILIGHSLESDFRALKMTHPFIADTSILYPHPRGPPLKSGLKWLTQKYLLREIQKGHGSKGHDSIEDARACLDLVKQKCERGPKWGSQDANQESVFKRLSRARKPGVSVSATQNPQGRSGAVVDYGNPDRMFGSTAKHCISCSNDQEIVAGVKRAVLGDADGAVIPGGGVDFTFARLRELETVRGWKNEHRAHPTPDTEDMVQPSPKELSNTVKETVEKIAAIRAFLPPCTLFMVYSGTGDPLEMSRLQRIYRIYRKEFSVKKWDQLSVQWTDTEEQALKRALSKARKGVGFMCLT